MIFFYSNRKHEPLSRLITARRNGLKATDVLLDVGPTKLTIGDLWTLMPPDVSRKHSSETSSLTNFRPGWLIDKVTFNATFNLHFLCAGNLTGVCMHFKSDIVIFFQVVEAALWKLTLEFDVFAADATLATIAKRGSSTRLLWSGQSFTAVSKIFIPINQHGIHWTLLVRMSFVPTYYYHAVNN